MGQQEVQVPSAVVDSHGYRDSKQVLAVGTGATRGGSKLNPRVVLALQLVLVLGQEVEVPHVVKDDAIVLVPVKAAHGLGKNFQATHFQLQRQLEQGLRPFRLACLGGAEHDEDRIAQAILAESC